MRASFSLSERVICLAYSGCFGIIQLCVWKKIQTSSASSRNWQSLRIIRFICVCSWARTNPPPSSYGRSGTWTWSVQFPGQIRKYLHGGPEFLWVLRFRYSRTIYSKPKRNLTDRIPLLDKYPLWLTLDARTKVINVIFSDLMITNIYSELCCSVEERFPVCRLQTRSELKTIWPATEQSSNYRQQTIDSFLDFIRKPTLSIFVFCVCSVILNFYKIIAHFVVLKVGFYILCLQIILHLPLTISFFFLSSLRALVVLIHLLYVSYFFVCLGSFRLQLQLCWAMKWFRDAAIDMILKFSDS